MPCEVLAEISCRLLSVISLGFGNDNNFLLSAINVPESGFVKIPVFFQLNKNTLVPFRQINGAIQLNGIAGAIMHRIVARERNTLLHIPHADGSSRGMAMEPDRVCINRRSDSFFYRLIAGSFQYLVSGSAFLKISRENILKAIAFCECFAEICRSLGFSGLQHVCMLLRVGVQS